MSALSAPKYMTYGYITTKASRPEVCIAPKGTEMVAAAKAGLQCPGRRLSRISIEVANGVLAFKILRYTTYAFNVPALCAWRQPPPLGEVCADIKSYETVDTGFVEANKLPISIETLSATPFEDLLVGSEVSEAFVIRFIGLLGGTGRRKLHVTFTASREQTAAAEAGPRMRLWMVAAGHRINRGMLYSPVLRPK